MRGTPVPCTRGHKWLELHNGGVPCVIVGLVTDETELLLLRYTVLFSCPTPPPGLNGTYDSGVPHPSREHRALWRTIGLMADIV